MNFYQSIAAYYDQIFTGYQEQANFIKKHIHKSGQNSFPEIGCATGNLSLKLTNLYNQVAGIDLDSAMLDIAQNKQITQKKQINLIKLDMLDIQTKFKKCFFDSIVCLGNTLVHLTELNQITDFLKQTRSLLKKRECFYYK